MEAVEKIGIKPKRKYRKRTNLSIDQRKNYKKYQPASATPTVEFKSSRQLRYEKRQKTGDAAEHSLVLKVHGDNEEKCLATPVVPPAQPQSSADDAETDYFSDGDMSSTPSSYLQACIRELADSNTLTKVLRKCEEQGVTRHFMALMKQIGSGELPVTNMAFLLALEVGLLHSLENSTQMRYRNDTALFWEIALSIGGPRLLRLFSSDKHFGMVNTGECKKSKYPPSKGNYNFAVPDERILRKSKTEIPKDVECGIISESFTTLEKDKEFILSLDGKQVGQGLKEDGVGDVNLWGFEGPPSLKETLQHLRNESNNILAIADKVYDQEDKSTINDDVVKDLKFVVQTLSCHIKCLREAKVHHEILRSSFKRKIAKFPEQGSRYKLAFSDIDAFIAKADHVIKDILDMNAKWCCVMAAINRNTQCFLRSGTVDMEQQRNYRILLKPNAIEARYPGFLDDNPEYVQQRTPEWFAIRRQSRITGSSMHNALGFRTLKAQKDHYDEFVLGTVPPVSQTPAAMVHGTANEVVCYKFLCNLRIAFKYLELY